MTDLRERSATGGLPAEDREKFWPFGLGPGVEPSHRRIQSAFEDWAQRCPAAIAVVHRDEQVTYGELDRRANCLASLLKAHGVVAGDRVGLFVHRSVPMLVGILATLKLGAAYVPQDIRISPPAHLSHIMASTGTNVILTLAEYLDRIPVDTGHRVIALDALALDSLKYDGSLPHVTSADLDDNDAAVVIFTSGTTGRPNGVTVTHANLCNVLLTRPGSLEIKPDIRASQLLNVAIDVTVWEIFGALSNGATLVIRGVSMEETVRKVDGAIWDS